MKFAVAMFSILMLLAAEVHAATSGQEPPKNVTVSPPAAPLKLPVNKIANPGKLQAYCTVEQHCPLREYSTTLGVCGLYVIKNGVVRLEMFNNSANIRCQEEANGIDKMFGIASVTKSITSTLLAQVLAEKYHLRTKAEFESQLQRQVGSFLKPGERKKIERGYATVQVNQLLLMRSDIGWREEASWPFPSDSLRFDDDVREPPRKEKLLEFAAHYKIRRRGALRFNYSALDAAMVMPVAASQVESGHLLKTFERGLWSMIGAKHAARWNVDKDGRPIGSCCFRAKIDDLARFGDFVRQKGKGKIPSAWFELATARTIERFGGLEDESDASDESCILGYGYFWWLRKGRDDFTAYGRDGQFIHIYPKEKVVIVQLSDWSLTKVSHHAKCIALKTHDEIVRQLQH
ncbi:serine hydrolase [Rhizobium mongolense]|uniref:CubicO group peptidase (Beta-lactamase class C family) n=2 Tax=Rhizobium mongolense TaxID=57676 RepID=A0ABR6IN57_9HYPH|nr:serine hydrolase [Rhizobium mongolense]MBB4229314.1 CubicO group peptidase (beta-lactamase class C family) [Rhizobium mongolense]TVZ63138.1 CubicO group peptidase (beta-lactamase class C family) [Rhizobium mongolense USDA 1844]